MAARQYRNGLEHIVLPGSVALVVEPATQAPELVVWLGACAYAADDKAAWSPAVCLLAYMGRYVAQATRPP